MKIKRSWLTATIIVIACILILYALIRQFTDFTLEEELEKLFFDGIFILAIGLFMLNRKLVADEKKEIDKQKAETDNVETRNIESGERD